MRKATQTKENKNGDLNEKQQENRLYIINKSYIKKKF